MAVEPADPYMSLIGGGLCKTGEKMSINPHEPLGHARPGREFAGSSNDIA
jgi:hypothetical protein